MKIPPHIQVFGDVCFMGDCPTEDAELITFFNELAKLYPSLAKVAIHPDNEGLVLGSGHLHHARQKAKGAIKKGAADIIICGNPTFVCEMKRQDHTKSRWQDGQLEFLEYGLKNGAFVCIALGYESALEAVKDWIKKAS
ncbi:MAG TPA: hypothetical protein PLV16_08770 [Agitococcus sp.]|nr:hypothetical protein [Agitococcus sp.]